MPVYAVYCEACGSEQDIYRTVSERCNTPECCGQKMRIKICAPAIISDIQPYKSMKTGEMITSRSAHKDHLRHHGLVEVGDQEIKPKTISESEKRKEKYELRKTIAQAMDSKGVR